MFDKLSKKLKISKSTIWIMIAVSYFIFEFLLSDYKVDWLIGTAIFFVITLIVVIPLHLWYTHQVNKNL